MALKGDAMGKLSRATKRAFDRVNVVSQTEQDPDLAIYKKMKPTDFVNLIRQHGETDVHAYIQEMEAKMKGRK